MKLRKADTERAAPPRDERIGAANASEWPWAYGPPIEQLDEKILHQLVRYIEYGQRANPKTHQLRVQTMVQELLSRGYKAELPSDALTLVQA